jgi:hypothetical protein
MISKLTIPENFEEYFNQTTLFKNIKKTIVNYQIYSDLR